MKRFFLIAMVLIGSIASHSQDMTKFKLYKPEENAKEAIEVAVKESKATGKHVLVQIGGNWCIWCARFNDFVANDKSLDSLLNENYVVYHLNYSKENNNADLLKKYSFPQRFGYPVFLVLDQKGDLIHTQSSWYLEDGKKSYDKEKVSAFFYDWAPKAFDPSKYKEKE